VSSPAKPDLEKCPHCEYILVERTTYCPFCGTQLTHPAWKKAVAWVFLILIVYGMVKCHIRLLDGFD
jgi:RNA polymerase subunit RPABC4/transcription elongation factor Spt4